MGYNTAVLDPDAHSPAGLVSHHHIHTDYLDAAGLKQLADACQAVTTEFENVPADALAQLATTLPVSPAASAVAVAQDRAREKAHFVACGVPVAPHAVIDTAEQLAALLADTANADNLLPGILKTSRMGYNTAVLDPDAHSPAGLVSHHHIHTDYLDATGLKQLADVCQAVTTEFENVPADALAQLAAT